MGSTGTMSQSMTAVTYTVPAAADSMPAPVPTVLEYVVGPAAEVPMGAPVPMANIPLTVEQIFPYGAPEGFSLEGYSNAALSNTVTMPAAGPSVPLAEVAPGAAVVAPKESCSKKGKSSKKLKKSSKKKGGCC